MKTVTLRESRAVYKNTKLPMTPSNKKLIKKITGPESVFRLYRGLMDETKEHFICLHLNQKNFILCFEVVSVGSLTASLTHPREVYKTALLSSAAALVFCHNHPSGNPAPSLEDREITKRLQEVGELHGIRVLDHVIIGHNKYFSFSDRGIL